VTPRTKSEMAPDHYAVLFVERTASFAEVRAAYKRLAAIHHPDKGGDHTAFTRLAAAFEVLGDESKRREYDRTLRSRRPRYHRDLDLDSPQEVDRQVASRREVAPLPVLMVAEVGVDVWSGAAVVIRHV